VENGASTNPGKEGAAAAEGRSRSFCSGAREVSLLSTCMDEGRIRKSQVFNLTRDVAQSTGLSDQDVLPFFRRSNRLPLTCEMHGRTFVRHFKDMLHGKYPHGL
jgi:hypothetical protein